MKEDSACISNMLAREIIDSRGNPTIEVDVILQDGSFGRASIPSGASTGSREAIELRDHNPKRFNGKGVLKSISLIREIIEPQLQNKNVYNQASIDHLLVNIDSTPNKSYLGANTCLAVSLAVARAASQHAKLPTFKYLSHKYSFPGHILPFPLVNILNGGLHADNDLDIQEFMIVPIGAKTFADAMQISSEIFHALKTILNHKGLNTNYGDEGGFAPNIASADQALDLISESCIKAGYLLGKDVSIALDTAASEFYKEYKYILNGEREIFDADQLIEYYRNLINRYNIFSIEDPMAEDDSEGWAEITKELGSKVQLVGDDLFVTNPKIFREGINNKLANAILIKPNQIGTLTETFDTIEIAKKNNYKVVISHRSGETEDTFISHLAVASNAQYVKFGSMARSERLAKYNELIRIEEVMNRSAL